jgi:rubredoxin
MSRVSSAATCPTCGAHIRSGPDADAAAIEVNVDDELVDHRGELLAALSGRKTYSLEDGRLYRRYDYHLRKPATKAVIEHKCWEPCPVDWLTPPAPRKPQQVSSTPPF